LVVGVLANARHLPAGRSRAGDHHLNFHDYRDNLADGATQYDTSNAIVSQLAPGQSSEQKATSVDSDVRAKVATSGLVCKVLDVTRFAA